MANELRRGAYIVCKPEGKDRMYTESDLKAAEAAAMAKAADILMQKHYADFYIGVSRAREIVLNCCTSDQRSALVERDAALLKEFAAIGLEMKKYRGNTSATIEATNRFANRILTFCKARGWRGE